MGEVRDATPRECRKFVRQWRHTVVLFRACWWPRRFGWCPRCIRLTITGQFRRRNRARLERIRRHHG